jgi:hypothetical protein
VRRLSWTCALPTHIHTILVWHIATTICEVMSPQEPLTGDRLVAKRLSDYCAYLVAFVPGMVPGHSYDTRGMFDAVVMEARNYFAGRECDTLRGRCVKLLELTCGRSSCCFPRHRATPRFSREAGEFITHLWALLIHAGILERPSSSTAEANAAGGGLGHGACTSTQDSAV